MKRCSTDRSGASAGGPMVSPIEEKIKRPRCAGGESEPAVAELGEDLVLEVLKRADARTVGRAACVCRMWRRLAVDERLWEVVCTRDWVKVPYGEQQLRALVLALGGFRRLHSLHILPFLHPSGRRHTTAAPALALPSATMTRRPQARWGKDEVVVDASKWERVAQGPGSVSLLEREWRGCDWLCSFTIGFVVFSARTKVGHDGDVS